MGMSTIAIPFFDEEIRINPHTASLEKHLGREVSLKEFAAGRPMRLERVEETGELIATVGDHPDIEFIHGPEAKRRRKKRYAVSPEVREQECDHEHAPYCGAIPRTGVRQCQMCGLYLDPDTREPLARQGSDDFTTTRSTT